VQLRKNINEPLVLVLAKPGAKIVYTAGAFDVLHPGHLAFLKAARALGMYWIWDMNIWKGKELHVFILAIFRGLSHCWPPH
jgi:bifunctional ADP-heptose synthase (sugar kinase/adenylyltransferase)